MIDWDNIKIGPREPDLWFYEHASVINDYLALNPNLKINYDLCLYYQTQRFIEDLRIAIETNDLQSFMNHWGWVGSYDRINKYSYFENWWRRWELNWPLEAIRLGETAFSILRVAPTSFGCSWTPLEISVRACSNNHYNHIIQATVQFTRRHHCGVAS